MRSAVRTPPEVWLNGRRLRSPTSESVLREEMERQRRRAYQLLQAGTPWSGLYEELLSTSDSSEASSPFPGTVGSALLGSRISGLRSSGPKPAPAAALASPSPIGRAL